MLGNEQDRRSDGQTQYPQRQIVKNHTVSVNYVLSFSICLKSNANFALSVFLWAKTYISCDKPNSSQYNVHLSEPLEVKNTIFSLGLRRTRNTT